MRLLELEMEQGFYREIDEAATMDHRKFWALVNSKRKKRGSKCFELKVNGTTLRNPKDIADAWGDHFAELYRDSNLPHFDAEFKSETESTYSQYRAVSSGNQCITLDMPINEGEVIKCVDYLKKGKSCGIDKVTNEHILFGGKALWSHLTCMFQSIYAKEIFPSDMKRGLIITLLKDSSKPSYDLDNYRGITLLPTLYKLMELIMRDRIERWKVSENIEFPLDQQCAYQRHISSTHASFRLQECVLHNIERGAKVYTCFLDSKKAFDLVWHVGLFVKLYELGIYGKLWRVLIAAHSGARSTVLAGGVLSRDFTVERSVHQGGVLSTFKYLVFINPVLKE
jgi:hypothetical protein